MPYPDPPSTNVQLYLEPDTLYVIKANAGSTYSQMVSLTFGGTPTINLVGTSSNGTLTPMHIVNSTNTSVNYDTSISGPGYLTMAFSYSTDGKAFIGPNLDVGQWVSGPPEFRAFTTSVDFEYTTADTDLGIWASTKSQADIDAAKAASRKSSVKVKPGETHKTQPKGTTKA